MSKPMTVAEIVAELRKRSELVHRVSDDDETEAAYSTPITDLDAYAVARGRLSERCEEKRWLDALIRRIEEGEK